MAADRLAQPDAEDGFLLDGFPRNIAQAKALDGMLAEAGHKLDAVLDLEVPEDEVVKRIAGRRTCRKDSSHTFHSTYRPPRQAGRLRRLWRRAVPARGRPRGHRPQAAVGLPQETEPIIDYYRAQGLVSTIPALAPVPESPGGPWRSCRTAAAGPGSSREEVPTRMVEIKTPEQIAKMRAAGLVVAEIHRARREAAVPGATTKDLDDVAAQVLAEHDAKPNFLGYGGFPATICTSVNDVVVHGIPDRETVLKAATSSPSTPARSSTAGTRTRRSPSSSARATPRSCTS